MINVSSTAREKYWNLNYCSTESAASSSPLKMIPRKKSPCRQHSRRKSVTVRKNEYKGMQGKDQGGLKQNTNPKPDRAESESDSKLIKLILDLKAEIGVLRKAMTIHGITIESAPPRNKE